MIKAVKNEQNNQSLNEQIESIVKDLKKDFLRLLGEQLNQHNKIIRMTKHKYQI